MDKNSIYVKNSISNLKEFAKSNGFRIVFKNLKFAPSEFCIMIYKRNPLGYYTHHYLVAYRGSYDSDYKSLYSFNSCWKNSMNYIRNYKN